MSKKNKKQKQRKKHRGESHASAVDGILEDISRLAGLIRNVTEQLHGLPAGRRGVLLDLEREGSQTVPQLARRRDVSRQHVQALVNPMEAEGLLESVINPGHKRSSLLRLTEYGLRLAGAIRQGEQSLYERVEQEFGGKELRTTTEVLSRLHDLLTGIHDEAGRHEAVRNSLPEEPGQSESSEPVETPAESANMPSEIIFNTDDGEAPAQPDDPESNS